MWPRLATRKKETTSNYPGLAGTSLIDVDLAANANERALPTMAYIMRLSAYAAGQRQAAR